MKSADKSIDDRSTTFWSWFETNSDRLAANAEDPELVMELDRQVQLLHPDLSWEIGPGREADWHLAISPNLNPDMADLARSIVSQAPHLSRWEFVSARQCKHFDGKFEIETEYQGRVQLDVSGWGYVLLRYPDGAYEILLRGDNLASLNENERWTAAAIALEGLLGEQVLMDKIDKFELTEALDSRFAANEKPISLLRNALDLQG